jgi:MerR family transcriptional regulator, copper efflux regulator
MNIRELSRITGIAERQIRYLIAEGFIPSPQGGRANADYGENHVAGIRRYMRLREVGFLPAAIKLLLEAREGAPFVVAPRHRRRAARQRQRSGAACPAHRNVARRIVEGWYK